MGIIKTENCVNHPEGGILLRNGSVIEAYRPEQIMETVDNTLHLDTMGVYFGLRNKKPAEATPSSIGGKLKSLFSKAEDKKEDDELTLFLNNAWYFYEHFEEICADSMKFLARVPVQSGLAYAGTGGFNRPTLGVYVEWWHSCDKAVVDLNGEKWLVWRISGSPLSGCNKCSLVNAAGKTRTHTILPFKEVWPSFIKVNKRYDDCKSQYMAYTIQEVVTLMRGDLDERESTHIAQCFALRSQVAYLASHLQHEEAENAQLRNTLVTTIIKYNEQELHGLYYRYQSEVDLRKIRRNQLIEERLTLRRRFKAGIFTQAEYMHIVTPISTEIRDLDRPLDDQDYPRLKELGITLTDLITYFE